MVRQDLNAKEYVKRFALHIYSTQISCENNHFLMHNTCRKETNMPTGFHNYCDITKGYDTVTIIVTNAYSRKYKIMQLYDVNNVFTYSPFRHSGFYISWLSRYCG